MARRWPLLSASVVLLVATLSAPPARALDEPERLRLVGERAFADGLYPLARRVLERFVAEYPSQPQVGNALLLLGRARLALGDAESALEALRRAQAAIPPAEALEAKFRSEEHTSELQSRLHLVCRLLLEKKKQRPARTSYRSPTNTGRHRRGPG